MFLAPGGIINNTGQINIRNNCTLKVNNPAVENEGTILINPEQGGNSTNLIFKQNTVLSSPEGQGFLRLAGDNDHAQLNTESDCTLINGSTHGIGGYGNVYALLNNAGTVQADKNRKILSLLSNPKNNSGTMRATGGGILNIDSIAITQSSTGIIWAEDTSAVEIANSTVNEGTIMAGSGIVTLDNSTINGSTLSSIGSGYIVAIDIDTLNGAVVSSRSYYNIPSGCRTTISKGLTNNGTITVNWNNGIDNAQIKFSDSSGLLGVGTVVLAGAPNISHTESTINADAGATFTQAAGHTIRGHGQIIASMINHGIINADSRDLVLQITTDNFKKNDGIIEATGDGILDICGGLTLENTGGTILADGGIVTINNGAIIVGGTLMSTGSSYVAGTGDATLSGVTVAPDSKYNVQGGTTTTINGLTNNGTVTINFDNRQADTCLYFNGSQILAGAGAIVLCDNNNVSSYAQLNASEGAILTQAPGHSIMGHGEINAALNNLGTVEAEEGKLILKNTVVQLLGTILTGGTWIAEENSTLEFTLGENIKTNKGKVVLYGLSSIFAKADALIDNQGNFQVLGGRSFTTIGDLANSGSFVVRGGGTFSVTGDLTGTGNTTVTDSAVLYADLIMQNSLTVGNGAT